MGDQATTSKNQDFRIDELLKLVTAGKIRIPQFQRSFRWTANDVLALFDSILRGYPFGGVLLWRRPADEVVVTVGALSIDAPAIDALWVIDGQQRITSLVNAVSPQGATDQRFAISYLLAKRRFVLTRDVRGDLAIPLPDLFDLGRALAWLQANPDAAEHAPEIQRVTALLRDVLVPASVIDEGDEKVLREIFDRINSAGRRLRGSEIFDAVHGGSTGTDGSSMAAIADRLDSLTEFGRLPDETVYQAILVIRHPDLSRNIRTEFSGDREAAVAFSADSQADAYRRGEDALVRVLRFLQQTAGVPHAAFVPFRFHLLVLARFFAHFPEPSPRNLELLSRWLWRSTALAAPLGYTGSTANIRTLANLVRPDDESGSVGRLVGATQVDRAIPAPDVRTFRTNNSAGKLVLAALWARGPVNPATHQPLSLSELAAALESEGSARNVALELFPGVRASDAANRVLAVIDRPAFFEGLKPAEAASHVVDGQALELLAESRIDEFLAHRGALLQDHVEAFIAERTGGGLEMTPPLEELDFDDIADEDDVVVGPTRATT